MSFLRIFTILYILIIANAKRVCEEPNVNAVGTVLFTQSDLRKQCWSQEEIAILMTRMIFEDLLPDISVLDADSNAFVDDIVSYFRLLIEVVKKATSGRKRRISLLALTDLLGGYLEYAVMPISRYSFYAGFIDYNSIEKLIQLYEELKWFLRTNGQGWAKPMLPKSVMSIDPINLETESPKENTCVKLIYYEVDEHNSRPENDSTIRQLTFPMPFFDSKVRPSSIAVPFKRFSLRNIESRRASYLLFKFFIAAMHCLKEKKMNVTVRSTFQNSFLSWLHDAVIPKLKDDKFYSAFGGVLRIEETLKILGANDIPEESSCIPEGEQEISVPEAGATHNRNTSTVILTILLIMIIVWFICGTVFICCRMRRQAQKTDSKYPPPPAKPDFSSSATEQSKWSLFSSKHKTDPSTSGKCKCSTKTTQYSSSFTSDYDIEDAIKKRKQKQTEKTVTICYPPYLVPSNESNKPAIIETKTTMKKLPSIEEISEVNRETRVHRRKGEAAGTRLSQHIASSRKYTSKPCPAIFPPAFGLEDLNTTSGVSGSTSKVWKKKHGNSNANIDECWCDILTEEIGEGPDSFAMDFDQAKIHRRKSSELKHKIEKQTSYEKSNASKQSSLEKSNASKQSSLEKSNASKQSSLGKSNASKQSSFEKNFEMSFNTDQSATKYSVPESEGATELQVHYRNLNSRLEVTPEEQDMPITPEQTGEDFSPEQTGREDQTADETSEGKTTTVQAHACACHSSLTGDYANRKRQIFGYDFETSSSSDLSEDEVELKTSTSK